jgi:hypothetical protein
LIIALCRAFGVNKISPTGFYLSGFTLSILRKQTGEPSPSKKSTM